jgi:serine/threonine protein kinase
VWIARLYGGEQDQAMKYAAIKVEIKPTAENLLEREFKVMKAIGKHQHIIEYIELGKSIDRFFVETGENKIINYLALEFAVNKTLLEYLIYQKQGYVEEKWVRYWFR